MKNLLKILIISIFFILTYSCNSSKDKSEKVFYHDIGKMLNDCDGDVVVIATSHDDSYFDGYEYFIVVIDSKNKSYTYQGSDFNISVGDTLKHRKIN